MHRILGAAGVVAGFVGLYGAVQLEAYVLLVGAVGTIAGSILAVATPMAQPQT